MTVLELAQSRIGGLKKKTAKEYAGPCPECGGTDRFLVWVHRDAWHCRGCDETGDAISFLRKFEGMNCPEAYAALGKQCHSTTCPAFGKCSQGDKLAAPAPRPLQPPRKEMRPEFVPTEATAPEDLWRALAEKLIDRANAALLDCPEQLAYLASRGLPREAVERDRLGWIDKDLFRPRKSWGLPDEISGRTGKPKKHWLPAGIVIPFFDAEGRPDRIRIRRSKIKEGEARYYWVPGSGNDVPVLGRDARAFVVVESDLDAFLVRWHAGDLVGAIPLGTCSAKPKETAMAALRRALAILVSLDFEPRENEKTGRHENPGGKAARWWLEQFPRAVRWPVPAGKDPGEYYQNHGGDIRAWVLAGLPPVFHVEATAPREEPVNAPTLAEQKQETTATHQEDGGDLGDNYIHGKSRFGIEYVIAERRDDIDRLHRQFPEAAPFLTEELRLLKGFSQEDAHKILQSKKVFPDSEIIAVRPMEETVKR